MTTQPDHKAPRERPIEKTGAWRPWLWRGLWLLAGLGLLAFAFSGVPLEEVWQSLMSFGLPAFLLVLGIFLLGFVVDSASWQLMLPSAGLNLRWLYRTWRLRMAGEAFNVILPAGSLGGEPVKAVLAKRCYGIGYQEGSASLVLAKTVNLLALIAFSAIGLAIMAAHPGFSPEAASLALAGFLALALGVFGFYGVQRWRLASRLSAWAARHRLGRGLAGYLHHIEEVDGRFVAFYRDRPRFAAAFLLAFLNWCIGTLELGFILWVLGQPLPLAELLLLETLAQLVRAGAFIIPGALGASEAAMVFALGAVTGNPALGLTLSLIRRGRELVWIAWGLLIAGRSWAPATASAAGKS